jgi:NAD+ synthase (glutamine-hydrolysing)
MIQSRYCTVASCSLDQWVLDFEGNKRRTLQSIYEAKAQGARIRVGPELELCSNSCEDHFLEKDTIDHCWEVLAEILSTDATDNIMCTIGMPVQHQNSLFNCCVVVLNRKIILLRPKTLLADDGNYRESRWFNPWSKKEPDTFYFPQCIAKAISQVSAPIGLLMVRLKDTLISFEICEEMWLPESVSVAHARMGAEIFLNLSASHHQLRKLDQRISIIKHITSTAGGLYAYANLHGCDGARLYFDGSSSITLNGDMLVQGKQFLFKEVEVITATVDLDAISKKRMGFRSFCLESSQTTKVAEVLLDFAASKNSVSAITQPKKAFFHTPEEEIAFGPACWMWGYLKRSGASGYFLPLSGGADSSSVTSMIAIMCKIALEEIESGNADVLASLKKILRNPGYNPPSSKDSHLLVKEILFTCYMGTVNSSQETRGRAKNLSAQIGATHYDSTIDEMVKGALTTFINTTQFTPKFESQGGKPAEDLALQNLQARSRMVFAYMMAQIIPTSIGKPGFLLVLGTGNLDEGLRGYLTKYDCSSADINPIGGINKTDLKRFLLWAADKYKWPMLVDVSNAVPTAELKPLATKQTDEEDMGMTYEELSVYGHLRKDEFCGPVSMYLKLLIMWPHLSKFEVAEKVKHFFRCYSVNRHKMTTITPGYHAESYGNDDNRYDLRPFLYNNSWEYQFEKIDALVAGKAK